MAEHVLEVEDVTLRFAGLVALDDVSFRIASGSVTGIIGPNGAGKSSLLNCINGFYRPASGDIRFLGCSVIGQKPHQIARMGVARTFQGLELVREASVVENVLLGLHKEFRSGVIGCGLGLGRARREEDANRRRAEEALAALGIGSLRHRRVGELAYGQQKLVSIARALAMSPKLLLLDEPTSGMHRGEKNLIGEAITRLRARDLFTQVIIEHDIQLIRDLCDEVIVLNFGTVLATGAPDVVLSDPRVIEAYVGKSADGRRVLVEGLPGER